jgi:glutamate-5-semialdehyde dehydrogenase
MTPAMREEMVRGLHAWRDATLRRDEPLERVEHEGWSVEARRAPLGVVGFVFEGRPNVFADATGVLRTGNTVVMRIGSDALATAEAIVTRALDPALDASGLPAGAVALVRSPARAAGWALFDDSRLALAVARGSGAAVTQLGAVARQAGTPVSLHGTGGAWLVAGLRADSERFRLAVLNSLDRKVCNTLNVCCVPDTRRELVPVFRDALAEAARRRGTSPRLHELEPSAELAIEWEWEDAPEVALVVTADVDEAVSLCNRYSPRFIASLVSDDEAEHQRFYDTVDAPFVGDGFTRWVDGQYVLDTPELGLSNWQGGRLFARGGILSGASVHTVRYRARVVDPELHR